MLICSSAVIDSLLNQVLLMHISLAIHRQHDWYCIRSIPLPSLPPSSYSSLSLPSLTHHFPLPLSLPWHLFLFPSPPQTSLLSWLSALEKVVNLEIPSPVMLSPTASLSDVDERRSRSQSTRETSDSPVGEEKSSLEKSIWREVNHFQISLCIQQYSFCVYCSLLYIA